MPPKSKQQKQEWLQCVKCKHLIYYKDTEKHTNECDLQKKYTSCSINGNKLSALISPLNALEGDHHKFRKQDKSLHFPPTRHTLVYQFVPLYDQPDPDPRPFVISSPYFMFTWTGPTSKVRSS